MASNNPGQKINAFRRALEHAMSAELNAIRYLRLAEWSWAKGQVQPTGRFLLLAGVASCQAGWLQLGLACGAAVQRVLPQHALRRFPDLATALRDPEFRELVHVVERQCSPERAEFLLTSLSDPWAAPDPNTLREDDWLVRVARLAIDRSPTHSRPGHMDDPLNDPASMRPHSADSED